MDDSLPPVSVSQRQSFIIETSIQNQFTQSFYHFDVLSNQSTVTAQDNIRIGNAYVDMGDLVTAVRYWEYAHAQMTSPDVLLLSRIARTYLELQDWGSAQRILSQLIALEPDNHWAFYQLGLIEAIYGADSASTHLLQSTGNATYNEVATAIIAVLPEHNTVSRLMSIGMILVEQNIWEYAELAFQRAVVMGGNFPEALAYQGWSRYQQGKDGRAWINQAIALAPDNPQVVYIQALESRILGNYETSLLQFNQALVLDPENPAFLAEIGQTHRLMNNLVSAEEWLARAVIASNNAPQFQELLALFYVDEGFAPTDNILQLVANTSSAFPDSPDIRASYGWTLYTAGDRDSALAEIDFALTLAPDNPRALYYRALIARDDGDLELATDLLTQVASGVSDFTGLAIDALSE